MSNFIDQEAELSDNASDTSGPVAKKQKRQKEENKRHIEADDHELGLEAHWIHEYVFKAKPLSQQKLQIDDALSYLGRVHQQFAQTPTRYYEFLEVMEEFKSRKFGINGVIDRVSKLFHDHPNLIDGFTTFLPPGFEVRVNITATGNYIQINQPNGVTHFIDNSITRQLGRQMAGNGNGPPQKPMKQEERLKKLAGIPDDKELWILTKTDEGKAYFYHAKTRETVWKQPDPSKAVVMLQDELQKLADQEYEEQLNTWEKDVTAYENSQKEKARDVLVENPLAETQKQQEIFKNVWTDTERAVFTEKIALYGKKKDFAAIAAFLPTKTVQECVHFYYMTKKQNNYKQTFRQRRKKTGTKGYRPPKMPNFGDTDGNSKVAKRPYPQQQEEEQSSSNKHPTSTICQPPAENKKKRIDVEAISILAKAQGLKKLDSFSKEQRNNILKMLT